MNNSLWISLLMNLTHVAFTLVMLLYNVQTQLGKEKLFLHCMNEITKKPDKATSFQPKFNTKLEKDKHTSARMGHSLCYYLPKWSLWGEIMVYLKLNEVTFPWNVSLTRKLLCVKKKIKWFSDSLQENESSSQMTCICLEVIQEERKSCPHPLIFENLHVRSTT